MNQTTAVKTKPQKQYRLWMPCLFWESDTKVSYLSVGLNESLRFKMQSCKAWYAVLNKCGTVLQSEVSNSLSDRKLTHYNQWAEVWKNDD
jgi:hypothetical protein